MATRTGNADTGQRLGKQQVRRLCSWKASSLSQIQPGLPVIFMCSHVYVLPSSGLDVSGTTANLWDPCLYGLM